MTCMTNDEIIAVVKAHSEGKTIEMQPLHSLSDSRWVDCPNNRPQWAFDNARYRIKPEPPKEIYINEYEEGRPGAHLTEKAARASAHPGAVRVAVLYREVKEN